MAQSEQKALQTNIEQIVKYLEHNKSHDVSLTDIMSLAEVMADSLDAHVEAIDQHAYSEFTAIAAEITSMKQEIAALCPTDMRNNSIPDAGRELDAVVDATENATNTIMGAAEEIMCADPSNHDAYAALVNDKIIEIFEACSFQDITGQRISKVVRTLSLIDQRVSSFIERLKVQDLEEPAAQEENEEERRRRELILHGPQHSGEGVNQDDVDQMLQEIEFDSAGDQEEKKSDQSEIDNLFA
ncbi:MAG: protein phosphatase CheZ [Cohaesibacter sp.]|nr:protein phosphatase CheZ [Cohaesibacter sp.]MCV6600347.1 protein phosphatase CheZ [Cohaesibacter sp.]